MIRKGWNSMDKAPGCQRSPAGRTLKASPVVPAGSREVSKSRVEVPTPREAAIRSSKARYPHPGHHVEHAAGDVKLIPGADPTRCGAPPETGRPSSTSAQLAPRNQVLPGIPACRSGRLGARTPRRPGERTLPLLAPPPPLWSPAPVSSAQARRTSSSGATACWPHAVAPPHHTTPAPTRAARLFGFKSTIRTPRSSERRP